MEDIVAALEPLAPRVQFATEEDEDDIEFSKMTSRTKTWW